MSADNPGLTRQLQIFIARSQGLLHAASRNHLRTSNELPFKVSVLAAGQVR